jgi:hypothetical protein
MVVGLRWIIGGGWLAAVGGSCVARGYCGL